MIWVIAFIFPPVKSKFASLRNESKIARLSVPLIDSKDSNSFNPTYYVQPQGNELQGQHYETLRLAPSTFPANFCCLQTVG